MAINTFTGANGDPVANHLTVVTGTGEIQNNKLQATSLLLAGSQGAADDTVSAVVNCNGVTTGSNGVAFRIQALDTYWMVAINDSALKIISLSSGTAGIRGDIYPIPSFNANADYLIEPTFSGRNITVKLDGVTVITYTHDSDFLITETLHGIRAGETGPTFDDLDIASTGSAVTESRLIIQTSDNLPASGTRLTRVLNTAGDEILYAGNPEYTNGRVVLPFPIADVPVSTSVDWVSYDISGSSIAGARQATVE